MFVYGLQLCGARVCRERNGFCENRCLCIWNYSYTNNIRTKSCYFRYTRPPSIPQTMGIYVFFRFWLSFFIIIILIILYNFFYLGGTISREPCFAWFDWSSTWRFIWSVWAVPHGKNSLPVCQSWPRQTSIHGRGFLSYYHLIQFKKLPKPMESHSFHFRNETFAVFLCITRLIFFFFENFTILNTLQLYSPENN